MVYIPSKWVGKHSESTKNLLLVKQDQTRQNRLEMGKSNPLDICFMQVEIF